LGAILASRYKSENTLVLALPRGGVPVGFEIAQELNAPLDVVVSKKLGAPHNKEFGIGAVAEEEIVIINQPTVELLQLTTREIDEAEEREEQEVKRLVTLYRQNRPLPDLSDEVVIVVDDGLATGVTAKAALDVVEKHHPLAVVFAAPVCALDTSGSISQLVDDTVCLNSQHEIQAISLWYQDFNQVSDEQVLSLLHSRQQHQYLSP